MNRLAKKEKSSAKKERKELVPPQFSEVQEYFKSPKYAPVEASKFYNYFQSNGWLVGGRSKMKDWKAAARNWMLNTHKFSNGKQVKLNPKQLHATTDKNYSEPL